MIAKLTDIGEKFKQITSRKLNSDQFYSLAKRNGFEQKRIDDSITYLAGILDQFSNKVQDNLDGRIKIYAIENMDPIRILNEDIKFNNILRIKGLFDNNLDIREFEPLLTSLWSFNGKNFKFFDLESRADSKPQGPNKILFSYSSLDLNEKTLDSQIINISKESRSKYYEFPLYN